MRTPPCGTYPEWCAICPCSWLTRWATVRRPAGGNGGAVLLPGPAFLLTETSGCFKNDVCVVDTLAFLVTVMILCLCFIVLVLLMCRKFGLNGRRKRISMIMVGVSPLSMASLLLIGIGENGEKRWKFAAVSLYVFVV